jgi:hypothetical protein
MALYGARLLSFSAPLASAPGRDGPELSPLYPLISGPGFQLP